LDLILANPAGLWALLGIPAVLLIHMLEQRPRRILASTSFLLGARPLESRGGRVLDRVRHSVPLLLQLLAVALLAALLAEPRTRVEDSAQTVVVVVDDSASMSAHREATLTLLRERLVSVERAAERTEWIALASDPDASTYYTGAARRALLEAVDAAWKPRGGEHDVAPVLQLAQRLAGAAGLVLFVTDHAQAVPDGVVLLSAAEPIQNVGFAGVELEPGEPGEPGAWVARVRSYADSPQARDWWIEVDGARRPGGRIELAPGTARLLRGAWPAGAEGVRLGLDPDGFALDDVLPMVRPRRKPLYVHVDPALREALPMERLLRAVGDVAPTDDPDAADLALLLAPTAAAAPVDRAAMVFLRGPTRAAGADHVVSEPDTLADGLRWEGLLCGHFARGPLAPGERGLLWRGRLPLLSHVDGPAPRLIVNFDLERCNAPRLPAFVVALARFVEATRATTVRYEASNVELGQALDVAHAEGAGTLTLRPGAGAPRELASNETPRAPRDPQLFEIAQGERVLLRAAARFADVREADLRQSAPIEAAARASVRDQALRNSRGLPLRALWIGLLLAVLLGNWWALGAPR